ncbi:MAG: hypothetical protein F6K41_05790 [Symploca sp. SIO3E6]|nr:hypothetical protein [Caldora sp. SIO3E6]
MTELGYSGESQFAKRIAGIKNIQPGVGNRKIVYEVKMDISVETMMVSKEQVLAILLMRFNLQPSKATLIVQTWFRQNPAETWETLKNLLSNNQVIVSEGVIRGASQSITPESPMTKYRGTAYSKQTQSLQGMQYDSLRAKGRRYRGVKY